MLTIAESVAKRLNTILSINSSSMFERDYLHRMENIVYKRRLYFFFLFLFLFFFRMIHILHDCSARWDKPLEGKGHGFQNK